VARVIRTSSRRPSPTELGTLHDEYERGYDWFHQGESLHLFYFLCMAASERWAGRALRFADLYVDPARGNYDPRPPAACWKAAGTPSPWPIPASGRSGGATRRGCAQAHAGEDRR
jgi:hypothetical protein